MRHARHILTAVVVIALAGGTAWASGIGDPDLVKWSQPPVRPVADQPELILGWDQESMVDFAIAADDFRCNDPDPIVDVHWWGSFPYAEIGTVPTQPDGFLIRFWTDVPVGADPEPLVDWSHPKDPIWQIDCRNYTVEDAGYDIDPNAYQWGEIEIVDQAYQYNQTLEPSEYFHQTLGAIYWISIQAYWDKLEDANQWGWKTRPHFWNDDAVFGYDDASGEISWNELWGPDGNSWDLAFELSVPEPATMALLSVGGVAVLIRRRRRR